MTRVYRTFKVEDIGLFKQKMLSWATQFNIFCFLDNQNYKSNYSSYECLLAVGTSSLFNPSEDFCSSLSQFVATNNDWLFGHFNYEIKDKLRTFSAANEKQSTSSFPDSFLFVPENIIILNANQITIGTVAEDPTKIFVDVNSAVLDYFPAPSINFHQRISREKYIQCIHTLKEHISRGDCYEINFCQEFYSVAELHPSSIFSQLINISPNPFSALYRIDDHYLICASPERFLKKTGNKIISQPIKGTAPRHKTNVTADNDLKDQLKKSIKDQTENVMIVDLVRNDLSKICAEGSVHVEELFKVYSYPKLHHMISTVVGKLADDMDFGQILQATFPMGSMTGAPKEKVIDLINKYEDGCRGIYSGTVGYISPEKDFDFNVIIRSLVYNAATKYLSFHTGSAITATSKAEEEYDECILKGKAIMEVFAELKKPGVH